MYASGDIKHVHGAVVFDRYSRIHQVIGIPAPPGFIPAIPKYEPCKRLTPWSRAGIGFCRILVEYTPAGVEDSARRLGMEMRFDGLYNARMPYLRLEDVTLYTHPQYALEQVYRQGHPQVLKTLYRIARSLEKLPIRGLGLTGSLATLTYNPLHSDIDIVVFEALDPAGLVETLETLGRPELDTIEYVGPLRGSYRVGWRRRLVDGKRVTFVAAPREPGSMCKPLSTYWTIDPPAAKAVETRLYIPPGQPSALHYPPCAHSEEGVWIVSFEYNVALELFEGGEFRVTAEAGSKGHALYVGVRGLETGIQRV
ncbi:hypothetical protein [Aeropyrum pernix]|uniref:hypothetical protein n=1 Tax=Aeropyrum pernix TaxID=56636 RepID=UPI0010372C0A|nr:hypothetical protein [Aeropyrum pernix]